MGTKLNKMAYAQLIKEDIQELHKYMPESLERNHIEDVLLHSVGFYYPPAEDVINNKTAPFQVLRSADASKYPSYKITWEAHLMAYNEYAKRYGSHQSADRIAERGGFGDNELDVLLPNWREYIVTSK